MWPVILLTQKLLILVEHLVLLLLLLLLLVPFFVSMLYPLLCFLCLICFCVLCALSALSAFAMPWWVVYLSASSVACSVCVCCASISCLLVYIFYGLLRLCLLYLGKLSACLHLPWLAPSAFAIRSVCICYALVNCLLRLRLAWLAPSASAVCAFSALSDALSTLSVFAISRWVICSLCIFYSLFCLRLLSVPFTSVCYISVSCLLRLRLP